MIWILNDLEKIDVWCINVMNDWDFIGVHPQPRLSWFDRRCVALGWRLDLGPASTAGGCCWSKRLAEKLSQCPDAWIPWNGCISTIKTIKSIKSIKLRPSESTFEFNILSTYRIYVSSSVAASHQGSKLQPMPWYRAAFQSITSHAAGIAAGLWYLMLCCVKKG